MSTDSGPGRREVAYRIFAAEFDDATLAYSESDEERAPNYVVTPTGARINRLFAVGVLTEIEDVNPEMVRGRVVDPTGAFVTYAGQYQPEVLAFLERADPPAFLAVTGKARTFEPDDGDRIYTSVRPESVGEVDADTRDRWVVTAAERTIDRVGVAASAIRSGLEGDPLREALVTEGVDERLADGVALALEHYETTPAYLAALRELALDAVAVVAGDLEEAGRLEVAPGEGVGDPEALATLDLSAVTAGTPSEADPAERHREAGDDPEPIAADDGETMTTDEGTEGSVAADDSADGSGEFDADEPAAETPDDVAADPTDDSGEFDPGEFELDDETRQEVQDEYGTEFSTADEIGQPGEAGIETPDRSAEPSLEESTGREGPSPETDPDSQRDVAGDPGNRSDDTDEGDADTGDTTESEDEDTTESKDEAVDIEDAVMETMTDLDDGEGAAHDDLVAAVVDAHGVDPEDVREAIQGALMSGRCYEPEDDRLKPI